MIGKNTIFIISFLCCIYASIVNAQLYEYNVLATTSQETGLPFIQNYSPLDYDAGSQNWAIAQSSDGLMYFGNNEGVLEYDGVSWRLIQLPSRGVVRSLAVTGRDRIYVGGYNDLGYLAPDSIGLLHFVSLAGQLDTSELYFQDVWNIAILDKAIYFQSKNKLMRWQDHQFTVWDSKTTFSGLWTINNTLFIAEQDRGIKRMRNDSLLLYFNAEEIEDYQIMDLLPFHDNQLLVLTQNQGLFVVENEKIKPLSGKVSDYLIDRSGRQGTPLTNGWFSWATMNGGIVVMDNMGNLVRVIEKTEGIASNTIVYQYEDDQKGLWLATGNGISRVELLSPYSLFDDRAGVVGYVNRIYRHKDGLYAANAHGVLKLTHNAKKNSYTFKPLDGITGQAFYFLSMGDTLVAASRSGTYMILTDQIVKRFNYSSSALLRSDFTSDIIYLGLRDGLAFIQLINGRWMDGGRINGIKDDIREINEDENGNLWLESQEDGVWKIELTGTTGSEEFHNPRVRHYRHGREIPEGVLFLHKMRHEIVFAINADIYKYDDDKDSIILYPDFGHKFGLTRDISPKLEDDSGNIWLFAQLDDEEGRPVIKAVIQRDGSYTLEKIYDERLSDNLRTTLLPEENGVVWYGGSPGIVRQDLNMSKKYDLNFHTHLRRVAIDRDSMIFGGSKIDKIPSLPFRRNKFRFEYSTTSFENEAGNLFQSYLDGFDDDWSAWTRETQRDYTNIHEGDYIFRVRAKNIYGQIGKEDSYRFAILPPWHRSWWAYLFYFLGGALLVWLFSVWYSRQLLRKNLVLEAIIKRRTNEIQRKSNLLSLQTERLKAMDTMKTRLFTNISHEFRTPLTLIKGPIEKLEQNQENQISTFNIKMIRRNANRLLGLVNQLLDLSKLDSGKLRLNPAEGDVFKCLRAAASAFSSHAASHHIDYKINIPSSQLWAAFDRDKMEKIIYNLLSNAFKFTEDEGVIILRAHFYSHKLHLTVSDSGNGISQDKLPNIFDRFFQVDDSYTREKPGSGIGLALTKELVDLMKGEIYVESEIGQGTIFRVVLPIEEIQSREADAAEYKPDFVLDAIPNNTINTKATAGRPKVLIIEDNHDMRHFIREQLHGTYSLIEALNGTEGLMKASQSTPDLIITDLMMPRMDGIILCKKLKTTLATSHIPVIMLTAKAGIENKLDGLRTGADVYLTKPFDVRELQVQVGNLIEQRQRLRTLYSKGITIDPKEITVTSMDEEFLVQMHHLLEEKYKDETFGVTQMQKSLAMSKTQLHRKLKALTNHPPGKLLRNFRLKRAAQLLSQRSDSITHVAYDVGFNSLSYFTRCFKELYGVSPTEYIRRGSSDE